MEWSERDLIVVRDNATLTSTLTDRSMTYCGVGCSHPYERQVSVDSSDSDIYSSSRYQNMSTVQHSVLDAPPGGYERPAAVPRGYESAGVGRRVWMLTGDFHPGTGGGERQAQRVSRELIAKGWSVGVITRRHGFEHLNGAAVFEVVDTIPVHRVYARGGGKLAALLYIAGSIRLLLRYSRRHIYHAHGEGAQAWAAIIARYLLGGHALIKLRSGVHAYRRYYVGGLARWLFIAQLRLADRIIVVSREVEEYLLTLGIDPARIELLPNGVDTRECQPVSEAAKAEVRLRLGLPEDTRIVLYVGRLETVKGLDLLIAAWAMLPSMVRESSRLVLVGLGAEQRYLEQQATALGVRTSVLFAGHQSNVIDYYRSADVFVLPSRSEGLSNALAEAMACGLPPVASAVGGALDLISHGHSGYLFEAGNIAQLSERLADLLDRRAARAAIGRLAREAVIAHNDMPMTIGRLERLYDSLGRARLTSSTRPQARTSVDAARLTDLEGKDIHLTAWNTFIGSVVGGPFMQTTHWALYKQRAGWRPILLSAQRDGSLAAVCMVLHHSLAGLPIGGLLYVPRGPVLDYSSADAPQLLATILRELKQLARLRRAVVRISPDVRQTAFWVRDMLLEHGFSPATTPIQHTATMRIDLAQPLDELLAGMQSNRRKLIRQYERDTGLWSFRCDNSADSARAFYSLYQQTLRAARNRPKSLEDILLMHDQLAPHGSSFIFLIEHDGTPLAGAVVAAMGRRLWYLYGGSMKDTRSIGGAGVFLHWEIMKWARTRGYREYDLQGLPKVTGPDDPKYGVYWFKQAWGGEPVELIGEYDYAQYPFTKRLMDRALKHQTGHQG